MPRDQKPSQPTEIQDEVRQPESRELDEREDDEREPQAHDIDEREDESEYDDGDDDSDDDEDDDDLDDDDDDDSADMSRAPHVEENVMDMSAYDDLAMLAVGDRRAEYEVEEDDIFEEIDLDLLAPVDGLEGEPEYA